MQHALRPSARHHTHQSASYERSCLIASRWKAPSETAGSGRSAQSPSHAPSGSRTESELVCRTVFYIRQEADQAIGRYIDGFYNPVRSALNFTSPAQFEKSAAE
jgi:hypothetical protein